MLHAGKPCLNSGSAAEDNTPLRVATWRSLRSTANNANSSRYEPCSQRGKARVEASVEIEVQAGDFLGTSAGSYNTAPTCKSTPQSVLHSIFTSRCRK